MSKPIYTDGFGLVIRWDDSVNTGYRATITDSVGIGAGLPKGSYLAQGNLIGASRPFDQAQSWHTYRLEAARNSLRLFVDGAPWLERTDNRYLTGRQVGIYTRKLQVNVRGFRVLDL